MRTRFTRGDDSVGDFSVAFGDMMFGMLFIFFLFALVLVFNRPDVDSYQREEDKLLQKLAQADARNTRLESSVRELRQEEDRRKEDSISRQARVDALVKESEALNKEIHSLRKDLEEARKKETQSDRERAKLSDALDKRGKDMNGLRQAHADAINRISEVEAENTRNRMLFESCKELLRSKGLLDVLAEVETIENGPSKEESPKEEKPPLDVCKLYAKLYKRDVISLKIQKGNAIVFDMNSLTENEVITAATDIMTYYKKNAESYPDADKAKYAPKLHLMCNPEASYGTVENLMKSLHKVMPVQVLPWTD